MESDIEDSAHTDFEEKFKPVDVSVDRNKSEKWIAEHIGTDLNYHHEINWNIATPLLIIHLCGLWGLKLIIQDEVQRNTILWSLFIAVISTIGVSVGAHRYYCHQSFKASPLLEIILLILQTTAGQLSVFTWSRDHRQHHRYSDTDADPHNSKRGLFFCYVGWIINKRTNLVMELGRRTYMKDLKANKFVMFQKRNYVPLFLIFCVIIPTTVPVYFFQESWTHSLLVAYFLRHALHLNYTWAVVIFGHKFGTRPFDKNIQPVESQWLSILSGGDGNHNYHHVFPWDYKTAEGHNFMSIIIWFCKFLGLAYHLKTAPLEMIQTAVLKKGDGTHHQLGTDELKSTVTAIGPLHPLNPTYRSIKDPEVTTRIFTSRSSKTEIVWQPKSISPAI